MANPGEVRGTYWQIDKGEINEVVQYRIGYVTGEIYDAYFPIASLGDAISTLIAVDAVAVNVTVRGSFFQATKSVHSVVLSYLGGVGPELRFVPLYLADLISTLSAFQSVNASLEVQDWDSSKTGVGAGGGGGSSTVSYSGGAGLWPTYRINTVGLVPITSTEDYVEATWSLAIPGDPVVQTGTMQIRGRGNYTWGLPKKPYRLNFSAKISPLGMEANEKNWALLANHDDPRKTGYSLGLWLAKRLERNLDWTPEFRQVELVLNNVYNGFYLLTDLWRVEGVRVPPPKATGATGLSLTGTWLSEITVRYITEGDPGFTTIRGVMIAYDEPGVSLTSTVPDEVVQAKYFRDHIQKFEDALFHDTFLDPTLGYSKYIDARSFAVWYLVCEFTSSQDSNFTSSIKLWKEQDTASAVGKLHMGVWDLSISFGLVLNEAHNPNAWYTWNGAKWIRRMWADPTFKSTALSVWAELKSLVPELLMRLDTQLNEQEGGVLRDEKRWQDLPRYYSTEALQFTKDWINKRVAWMDTNLPLLVGSGGDNMVPDSIAPSAPPSLVVTTSNTNSITFTWGNATDNIGVTGYRHRVNGGTPVNAGMTNIATAIGLAPLTTYTIEVSATDLAGNWGPWASTTGSTVENLGYSDAVNADDPAWYMPLGDATWPVVEVEGASVVTSTAHPTLGVPGIGDRGTAAHFKKASSDYVQTPLVARIEAAPQAFTVEALVQIAVAPTPPGTSYSVVTRDNPGTERWWQFTVDHNGGVSFTKVANGVVGANAGPSILGGAPHHIAATYDGANIIIYIDGLEGSRSPATGNVHGGTIPITVGRFDDTGQPSEMTMAGIAMYDHVLSPSRIRAHTIGAGITPRSAAYEHPSSPDPLEPMPVFDPPVAERRGGE